MVQKRNQARHRKRLQLRYGVDGSMRVAFTEDVSDNGFFIRTAVIHPPNTNLRIELISPNAEPILLEGMVRWAKKVPPNMMRIAKGGMGIRITRFLSGEETYQQICEGLNGK